MALAAPCLAAIDLGRSLLGGSRPSSKNALAGASSIPSHRAVSVDLRSRAARISSGLGSGSSGLVTRSASGFSHSSSLLRSWRPLAFAVKRNSSTHLCTTRSSKPRMTATSSESYPSSQ